MDDEWRNQFHQAADKLVEAAQRNAWMSEQTPQKISETPMTTVTVSTTPGFCLDVGYLDKNGEPIKLPYSGDAGDETE